MAHELSIIDGIAEFAYLSTEGAAWHHFGQAVEPNSTEEQWNAACNISNWTIEKQKALMMINGALHRVPNTVHLTRSDNNAVLATVSEQFNVHQPQEVSAWVHDAVRQLGFEMATMGVLFDGKKFWAQANMKQSVMIGSVDRVDRKLLIMVPNTGKEATQFIDTQVRVVCNNTARAAMRDGKSVLKLSHLQEFKPAEISEQLGLFDLADYQRLAEEMTRVKLTDNDVYDYMGRVFKLYEEVENDTDEIAAQEERIAIAADNRAVVKCFENFHGAGMGAELVTAKGTLWGAYNAVTQYVDHDRRAQSWETRFDSSQFGQWANVKDRAWDEAIIGL